MKRVFLCSPYRGNRDRNADYLDACIADSLKRGEAPFAPHGFYPQFLDDDDADQRRAGIDCGLAWLRAADLIAVYRDLGRSTGMEAEIAFAQQIGIHLESRSLGMPWRES